MAGRGEILHEGWGVDLGPTTRTVDDRGGEPRKALGRDPKNPRHIVTVHGAAYRLVP